MNEPPPPRHARAVGVLCVFIAALSLIYVIIGDRTIWGEWISVAPPILWGLLLLPSAVRLRSWTLCAFIVGFLLLTTEWPRWGSQATSNGDTIRVASWNIGAGNTKWAEAIQAYEPDIVLVQESMKPLQIWEGFHWFGTLDPGVLSRFPAQGLATKKIGPWMDPQLLLMEVGERKILVANVRLMLPSPVIQLVNPLDENPLKNYRARVAQYEELAALLESTAQATGAQAILLTGDFNIPARMHSLAPLRRILGDAWLTAGTGWGATVPEFFPLTRIDQVWLSREIRPVSVRVVRIEGSDHRAVIADVTLPQLDQ